MKNFSKSEASILVDSLVSAIDSQPLRLGVIGTSGVGKSSTINALFDSNLSVSHTVACTKEFTNVQVSLNLKSGIGCGKALLTIVDAPGLGESLSTDPGYLTQYRNELPKCDAVLWLLAARNRGLALDQRYLKELYGDCPNVVFGINQVDLTEPRNWSTKINLPSEEQLRNIKDIEKDRREKIKEIIELDPVIVSYSAQKKYNLSSLFEKLIDALPSERRALYDLVRGFKIEDQFPPGIETIMSKSKTTFVSEVLAKFQNFFNDILNTLRGES